ncbi:MAG: PadR family transcriptional regulator [Planctomycetota bacterium]
MVDNPTTTEKDLVAASATPIVLGILARGESYGYAILKEIRDRSNGTLDWSEGMLYPVLHRLELRGLLRSRWATSDEGRRRKCYQLSKAGRAKMAEGRTAWQTVDAVLRRLWREAHA